VPHTVGFVLLSHTKPKQVIRLINTLNRMFANPPIACHHDFTQCDLPSESFTKNISLVNPHVPTAWGGFSLVEAVLRALQLLYESKNHPDWFILLSGADYPIKPAERILHDLTTSEYDAHIHHEKIRYNNYDREWQELCHKRYCSLKFRVPFINKKLELTHRVVTLRHPLLTKPFLPFSKNLSCFAGQQWFAANRKAAKYLMEYHRTKPALRSHYRRLDRYNVIPDESYYQTILCNAANLKVSQNIWRYVDWSIGGRHPKTLLLEDLPKLNDCSAHFARKFDIDADVAILNTIDKIILNCP